MKTLARFIQQKREELGLTQGGLAQLSFVSLEIIEEVEDPEKIRVLY